MNSKCQIESIRQTAIQLAMNHGNIFHAQGAIRGQISELYIQDDSILVQNDELGKFWGQLLCTKGNSEDVICRPYNAPGFSFEAAMHPGETRAEDEEKLEGIDFSILFGSAEEFELLTRLIAAPITKYLRKYTGRQCARLDSYRNAATCLSEWVRIIYEIGIKMDDPNIKRCYRLLSPLSSVALPEGETDILCGYSDINMFTKKNCENPQLWDVLWTASNNQELAYSTLCTDLFVASRIALDYLIEDDFISCANEFEQKWRKRTIESLTDTERYTLEALGTQCLIGEEIAKKAGYDHSSGYRAMLSNLWKRLILEKNGQGYFISPDALWILEHIKTHK
jgi:hypothetical protein